MRLSEAITEMKNGGVLYDRSSADGERPVIYKRHEIVRQDGTTLSVHGRTFSSLLRLCKRTGQVVNGTAVATDLVPTFPSGSGYVIERFYKLV
jgi:hypothetical protein